jgi:predicted dehydrogenase
LIRKYNVAIVGCGAISQTHIDSINKIKTLSLKAVCDIDMKKAVAVAQKYGCKAYKDYKETLADKEINSVHILTPHYLHVPIALEALKLHRHVVLEKPVGINPEEIKKLIKAERESKARIGVVLQNRYNKTSQKMKSTIGSGEMGALIAAKGLLMWHRDDGYYLNSGWRGKWETEGGGLLINQAIHTLDLLRYLGGEIKSLKGHAENAAHEKIEVEDTALATLYYKNGAVASFFGTNNHGTNSRVELEFVFENGTLRLLDDKLYKIKQGKSKLIAKDTVRKGKKDYWGLSHTACIKAFYDAVTENREADITVADAAKTNELVLGIYNSSKTNEKYIMTEEQK